MQGKVNYTLVGVFVVVLTTFLIIGIFWLSAVGANKNYQTYLVYVNDNVTGLSVESPVRFNGVKVGYVKSIKLDANNPKQVELVLNIEPHTPISTSTYAILTPQGITGVIYVNLNAETDNAPLLKALPGKRYPEILSKPSLLMQLSAVLPNLAAEIQNLSKSVSQVLDVENRNSIKESLKNIAIVTKTLADNSKNFTEAMQSLNTTLSHISVASDALPETMEQLDRTLTSVSQLSTEMTKTSDTISSTMQSGKLVLHNFSSQVMPNAQEAISNLSQATRSMHQLTDELQRDPSMLVRGKPPAQLGPGER